MLSSSINNYDRNLDLIIYIDAMVKIETQVLVIVVIVFVRFVVVCGDGEYIIYTAMALRNKSFGSAQEFVWASDSSEHVQSLSNRMIVSAQP